MSRRTFLDALAAALLAGVAARADRRPRLLLRSSWQTVNIGDIAHTPGVLALLERHLPEVEVALWPVNVDRGVEPMLARRFPQVKLVKGRLNQRGEPTTPELAEAFNQFDLLLHGSGPSVVAQRDLAAWARGGKPFGVYGVSLGEVGDELRALLSRAAFVFCRDTTSLTTLRAGGVTETVTDFAPDGAFGFDLRDDEHADAYLAAHGLEPRGFLAAVPRLRYTPYHRIHPERKHDPADVAHREAVNAETAERDHAKLRGAITRWVRETALPVLVCPEMTYELEIIGPLVVDPLPDDVKAMVVARDTYWLPDEAASVYARARALVSFEMHSPILAAAADTPAVHLRQPTDTVKGQMWRDVGLSDWIFEIDEVDGDAIGACVLAIHRDYPAAQAKLGEAMTYVRRRQAETMAEVRQSCHRRGE